MRHNYVHARLLINLLAYKHTVIFFPLFTDIQQASAQAEHQLRAAHKRGRVPRADVLPVSPKRRWLEKYLSAPEPHGHDSSTTQRSGHQLGPTICDGEQGQSFVGAGGIGGISFQAVFLDALRAWQWD